MTRPAAAAPPASVAAPTNAQTAADAALWFEELAGPSSTHHGTGDGLAQTEAEAARCDARCARESPSAACQAHLPCQSPSIITHAHMRKNRVQRCAHDMRKNRVQRCAHVAHPVEPLFSAKGAPAPSRAERTAPDTPPFVERAPATRAVDSPESFAKGGAQAERWHGWHLDPCIRSPVPILVKRFLNAPW